MGRSDAQGQDYAPFDDDYRGFDPREDETARGPVILALAVGVLLIFGAVVWNTYRQGIRPEGEGLPSVLAEEAPFKRAPDDAGGVIVPNTDKHFYDDMDATSRDAEVETASAGIELAGDVPPAISDGEPTNLIRGSVDPVVDLEPPAAPPLPAAQPAVTVAEPAAASPPPALEAQGPKARFTFAANGAFLVQIAALRSEEAAESQWKRVTASAPELYHGATKFIQRADLGPDGVFFRLRAGAFADRAEATAFCDAIKEAGANCIVVNG
jgi:cell division septation protein DedD